MLTFMSATGIVGDSTSAGRVGQIVLLTCNFGLGRFTDSNGLPLGGIMPRLIRVQKHGDSASPMLAEHCARGTGPDLLTIQFTMTTSSTKLTEVDVLSLELNGARIERFDSQFTANGDSTLEAIDISYSRITVRVTTRNNAGNTIEIKSYQFLLPK